jgi:hypothetical protein
MHRLLILAALLLHAPTFAGEADLLIDDFSSETGVSALGTRWSAISDRVMGGVSDVAATVEDGERRHVHLTGEVKAVPGLGSPGFVQLGLDLGRLDASAYKGLRLVVRGDGGTYGAHLRTPEVRRPWQSWRSTFVAPGTWTEIHIPFSAFEAYRVEGTLDLTQLQRLSLIAVDRLGPADLRVAEVGLYR